MVVDAVRTYLDAVSGLTELTRKRAVTVAKTLLRDGEARGRAAGDTATAGSSHLAEPVEGTASVNGVGHSIQRLASDLIETNQANRQALGRLVEAEVERVVGRMDLVQRSEYDRLARRVAELERRLAQRVPAARPGGDEAPVSTTPPAEGAVPSEREGADSASAEPEPAPAFAGAEDPPPEPGGDTATAVAEQTPTPSDAGASDASDDGTGEPVAASEPAETAEAAPAPADGSASAGGGTGTTSTGKSGTQKKKSGTSDKTKSSSGTRTRTTTKNTSTKRSSGRGKNAASAKSANKSDQN